MSAARKLRQRAGQAAVAALVACAAALPVQAQAQTQAQAQPQGAQAWWPSRYGPADTLGALNNISEETVRQALALARLGKVYALGVSTGPHTPAYGKRTISVERTSSGGSNYTPDGSTRATGFDERVVTSMGIGTQIDGLGHLGIDHRYYNGHTGAELAHSRKLDIAALPPIVTRGVLIDMARHHGKPMLQVGDVFNAPEIQAAAKAQGVEIRKGDVVLFHTGWIAKAETDPGSYRKEEPGLGEGGAEYLASLGVVAVGADTVALEALPSPPGKLFVVHQVLLAKHGVYILESLDTRALAADRASEFLFVLAPPRIEGTVQMIVNPVAIR